MSKVLANTLGVSNGSKEVSMTDVVDRNGPVIAQGTATFTNVDNNINLAGLGVHPEVGDVIQISGSTNNDTEFTVEFITDNDNVIVNAAHAGGTTSKSLVDETATVTVTLLCKWYLAPVGLGQGWVDVTSSMLADTPYLNNTGRLIKSCVSGSSGVFADRQVTGSVDGVVVTKDTTSGGTEGFVIGNIQLDVPYLSTYLVNHTISASTLIWTELR